MEMALYNGLVPLKLVKSLPVPEDERVELCKTSTEVGGGHRHGKARALLYYFDQVFRACD
jgi:hypothetical protein